MLLFGAVPDEAANHACNLLLTVAFSVDLALRFSLWVLMSTAPADACGLVRGFLGDGYRLLDFCIVGLDIVFLLMVSASGDGVVKSLRSIRIVKLVKITRATRVLRHGVRAITYLDSITPELVNTRRDIATARLAREQDALAAAGALELAYALIAQLDGDDPVLVVALTFAAGLLAGPAEKNRARLARIAADRDADGLFFKSLQDVLRGGAAAAREDPARGPVWKSNLQPDFNVRVCDRSDARFSAVLRELDESNRFVQKSAESTSI